MLFVDADLMTCVYDVLKQSFLLNKKHVLKRFAKKYPIGKKESKTDN